jgi:hypothetical protein
MANSRFAALAATVQAIRTGATFLSRIRARQLNNTAPVLYLQLFNVASGSVTLGTTVPNLVLEIPAGVASHDGDSLAVKFDGKEGGKKFSTALSIACTTTATGSTAPTAGQEPDVNVDWNPLG